MRPPLPRSVKALGLVSLLTDVSGEMTYPLLPAFLTRTLRKPLVVAGYFLSSLVRPLVALARAPAHVLAVRIAD